MDKCAPWPRDAGPQPWYACCYQREPSEHFVGVNGDTRRETMELWNLKVEQIQNRVLPAQKEKP